MGPEELLDLTKADLIKTPVSMALGYLARTVQSRVARASAALRSLGLQAGLWGIRQITDPDDSLLPGALELLNDRLPPNQLDAPQDIRRWLKENQREMEQLGPLMEYFFAAWEADGEERRVRAALYGQYYKSSRFFFVSYLAGARTYAGELGRPVEGLIRRVVGMLGPFEPLRMCRGFVFELDHEDGIMETTSDVDRRIARIHEARAKDRLFRRELEKVGLPVAEIDIPYRQPALSLDGSGYIEERMSLYYGDRAWSSAGPPRKLSGRELEKVLDFVFDEVYGDSFQSNGKNVTRAAEAAFRERLRGQKATLLAHAGEFVRLR